LERDTLERRVAALEADAERLQLENAEKDHFLATLAHELRTPLNAILGWVTLLRTGRLDPQAQERALATIERSARAQKRLIADALEASRIATGRVALEVGVVELHRVVEAALETMLPAAEARDIRLQARNAPGVATLRGDFARLQQVVCNLLSNAIKFSEPGGEVEVSLESQGSVACIRVRDCGKGIRAEFLPHVFERFRQDSAASGPRHAGLGIGLAIVRHLTELHGGSVAAESDGEGCGATFTVRLPLSPGQSARESAPSSPS
jgi:signal transduction histidine kinase